MLLCAAAARAEPVDLRTDTAVASAGYYQLRWAVEGVVIVQEASGPDFSSPRIVYRGTDNARVISGKPDGDWYYRARTDAPGSGFGEVVQVTVRHHPVERAFAFFAVGALVFLTTLVVIIRGARGG